MLPDERMEVKDRLGTAHQKLMEIVQEAESEGIRLQMICQIAGVQADLQAMAVSMLKCQLLTSLLAMATPGKPNSDEEITKFIEQYQTWLQFTI